MWCIEENEYDSRENKHFEGLFTQGSGYLSIRGSYEEGLLDASQNEEYMRMPANVTLEKPRHPKSKWGTYVPGIAGPHPLLKEEIINLPYFLGFSFYSGDEGLYMENGSIREYRRWLDMRDGVLHRSFIWDTEGGSTFKMYFKRYISMEMKNLCVQEIDIEVVSGEGTLVMESFIDASVRTNGYNHFVRVEPKSAEDCIGMEVETNGGNTVFELSKICSNCDIQWKIESLCNKISQRGEKSFKAGEKFKIHKLTAVTTDRDYRRSWDISLRAFETISTAEKNLEDLYKKHAEKWLRKWEVCDIEICGDEEAQRAIRFSMYHLIRSNAEEDPRIAICAKGYAGEAYYGHAFWDTEIYLLPFFLYTNPNAAKNLLMFRYNTLEGAKRNAAAYGYGGARYPWESSTTGEEQCSNWQYADNEIHITADIAYALMNYYNATGDYEFIRDYGIDILIETSRYWTERVDRTPGGYALLGVMGPDEYIAFSNNNAYTNVMVKFNLKMTALVLQIIKHKSAQDYEVVAERLKIDEQELMLFKDIESKLVIPEDKEKDLILQCEGFYNFADIDFNKVWEDRSRPFGHFVSQERMYRSKCLKQADVLGMMMLFPSKFTTKQMKNAYEYYEPITTHDSSLSCVVHAIIANWIGKYGEAEKFFKRAVDIDLNISKGGAAEGIHIANCGGLWQCIVFGFAGMKINNDGELPQFSPHLPNSWERLSFKIMRKSILYKIEITQHSCNVKALS